MRIAVAIQTALLLIASSSANAQIITLFSYADDSCGAWARSATNASSRAQYISWFRGFVSGYNASNQKYEVPLGSMPDGETLALYIDKYCREDPLSPFVSGAFKLIEEIRQPILPSKPKTKR